VRSEAGVITKVIRFFDLHDREDRLREEAEPL
jgi:hypothetical protein